MVNIFSHYAKDNIMKTVCFLPFLLLPLQKISSVILWFVCILEATKLRLKVLRLFLDAYLQSFVILSKLRNCSQHIKKLVKYTEGMLSAAQYLCSSRTVSTLCAYTSNPDRAIFPTAARSPRKSGVRHSTRIWGPLDKDEQRNQLLILQ